MLRELIVNNSSIEAVELKTLIFKGIEAQVSLIAVPCGMIPQVLSIYGGYKYSAIVGYPYGTASLEIKVHEIIESAKRGIKIFDVCISEYNVKNLEIKKIAHEFAAIENVVKDYEGELRVVLEHRMHSLSRNVKIATILKDAGLNTLILATGNMPQNMSDGVLTCYKIIQETKLDVIVYGNHWNERALEILDKAGGKAARSPVL